MKEAESDHPSAASALRLEVFLEGEIHYGSFDRVLTMPVGTKTEDVTAAYADGVLTVSMPAATPSAPQEVPVTHGDLPVG